MRCHQACDLGSRIRTPIGRSSLPLVDNDRDRLQLPNVGCGSRARVDAFMTGTGATSYPIPGKSEAEMQAGEPELKDLIESGDVTKGMPDKKKGRGGR